ncbi:MAG: PhoU domain-containing protein [Candidatus Aminicenantes bacterium]
MFKKIFAVWKSEGLLNQALETTEKMFELASRNFDIAIEELTKSLDVKRANIYVTDQKINECEKEVRRKVLEHLTINPKQDLSSSLILITVVKDLERIGDYVKNIVELAYHYPQKMEKNAYTSELIEISKRMSSVLKDSLRVFSQADVEKAKEYYKYHREVTQKTDSMTEKILEEKKLSVREAVVYALFARYLKRIAAHLANILTTVINPFHLVGYGFNASKKEEVE